MAIEITDVKVIEMCSKHGGDKRYKDDELYCMDCEYMDFIKTGRGNHK